MVERVLQIAEACRDGMSANNTISQNVHAGQVGMQPKDFLENILYFRVCSYTEQIALINYLDKFISEHRDVGICLPVCQICFILFLLMPFCLHISTLFPSKRLLTLPRTKSTYMWNLSWLVYCGM